MRYLKQYNHIKLKEYICSIESKYPLIRVGKKKKKALIKQLCGK